MILFNVYLTKVYHVRNILMFVNFWTEATNLATFVEIREILLKKKSRRNECPTLTGVGRNRHFWGRK